MRDIIEQEKIAAELAEQNANIKPEHAMRTPLATVLGLREAMRVSDYEAAGEYLDTRYLPEDLEKFKPEQLVRALGLVWSQQNIMDISHVSDDPEGDLNDGLPSYRDQIGIVTLSTGDVPIYLQRVPDGQGGRVWKMSNATVAKVPEMWDELGYSPLAIYLANTLPDFHFMGMDNWQVIATALAFVVAIPLSALICSLLLRLALRIPNNIPNEGITRFFRRNMRFFLFVEIARLLIAQLGLSLTARILLESSGVDYIAYTVLLLGLMSLIRDYQIRKMEEQGNAQYVALLKPFTSILKVIVVTLIALFWAERAGYNMSTILAGLGVGSLAVALAAQKTLENVIGALTLYTARPVNPGDFCRFGNIVGTVEEIGLRSTIIRTLNRTQVYIPNSVFSSVEVENYSSRDRIRYFRQVQLQMANADQLRFILAKLRELFLSHPEVPQETVSIRLETIEQATAVLRLDAGVRTTDYQHFLAVAEDLNLHIIELVHSAGAIFSGPGQVLQLREFKQASEEEMANIRSVLDEWRANDRLPFPPHSGEEVAQFRGSLDYPPKGSAS
jgi:MscS family membrane protein